MISSTAAYQAAISGDVRRILLRAVVDISDPDISYDGFAGSGEAAWSKSDQLHDREFEPDARYTALERGRWLLDGSFRLMPDNPASLTGQIGFVGDALSGGDGTFPEPQWMEQQISGVTVLQACTIYFSDQNMDGWPADFTVEVFQGGTAYFTRTFTDNQERDVYMDGFTVYDPEIIRITVTRWSLPGRRLRCSEIITGFYRRWEGDMVAELSVNQHGDVSCLSLPYGTCKLKLNNVGRWFEPRNPDSLFQSIEERQGITIFIGVRLADGGREYKPVGIYFQKGDGWKTSDNDITITWDLVDIIGLLTERTFLPPDTLPTTLAGWLEALVGHLGENFTDYWHADPAYADLPVTANSVEDVTDKKCGDILRWVCQASGTWPRADAETGYLTAEPLWSEGNKTLLTQILKYPTMKANDDIAMLIFYLSDGTEYTVIGTSTSSERSVTIRNPFIHTAEQAQAAGRLILASYGGTKIETSGRGDPASEIGDVDTVWLDESNATTGRRIRQSFNIQDGVLQNCQSTLLQADGSLLFEEYELITESGTWTAPAGKTRLRVIIGQGGQGGGRGSPGYFEYKNSGSSISFTGYAVGHEGEAGSPGAGGKIWYGTISINEQQAFDVQIGAGGSPGGGMGGETVFGAYSSENGKVYPNGFTDIASTNSYGRTGVALPLSNTGDGGAGGAGGSAPAGHYEGEYGPTGGFMGEFVVDVEPGPGQPGPAGGSGFVLVWWDKEET